MPRFVKPALWTIGVLVAGELVFWLLLAQNIPYRTAAAPETTPITTTPAPPAPPAENSAWVVDVRAGPDDRSAVLHVDLPACAEAPHVQVAEADDRIDAGVRFRARPDTDCTQVTADFPIRTAAPIGQRPVIVNGRNPWGLRSGGWRSCDRAVTCDPPADHCDPAWVAEAEHSAEAEHGGTTRACDQHWLIRDVQRHSGEPASRVVFRWAGTGWSSFASAKSGGCAEILAAEPQFPAALCRSLAAPA
ncbi:hypothetical protein [Amycolatopsis sp. NPDC004625]|uniref:hypothetical protein n=1 Tax=Amycolatopsis sp. NPDC004625 TaxID=3154670 RepID=UPI0033A9BDB5